MADTPSQIAKRTAINLFGLGVPILLGLIAVPLLISRAGMERFGFLTLIWAIIGYFALFDLGLGRAITHVVSRQLEERRRNDAAIAVATGLLLMFAVGLLCALTLVGFSAWLADRVLGNSNTLHAEAIRAFNFVALVLPFVVTGAGLRGALEGSRRFLVVAIVRILFAAAALFGPLVVLRVDGSLSAMTGAVCVGRMLAWAILVYGTARAYPELINGIRISKDHVRRLFRLGLWMTVSNVVSPLLVSVDKFVIGASVSVVALAYYATPSDVITKLLILPTAFATTLFAAISAVPAGDAKVSGMFRHGMQFVGISLGLSVLVVILFAHELLALWIDPEFASKSAPLAKILALGVLANGLAHVPFTLIQASGRPDITAKIHLAEVLPYVALLVFACNHWGLSGAAYAWLIRMVVDFVLLGYGIRLCGINARQVLAIYGWSAILLFVVGVIAYADLTIWARAGAVVLGGAFAAAAGYVWFRSLKTQSWQ